VLVGASPAALLRQLAGESGLGGLQAGSLFTLKRLVDLGNEMALVLATTLLLLLPALAARGRRLWRDDGVWLLLTALVPGPLLFLLVVPPHIGGARDWDLYLALYLPSLLLAVEAWRRAFAGDRAPAAGIVAGRALGFALVMTLAWLAVQLDASRAVRRLEVLQDPRGTFGNFARGYANETLAMYWRDRDEDRAREAYRRATEANPNNPRYFNNLATLLLRRDQIAPAREAFQHAYDLGMHDWFVLHNLGLCELQLGNPAAAEPLFDELVHKKPQMWQAWLNRGLAKLDQGRAAESLPDLDRAVELAPREADTHYTRGLALRQLNRFVEARACFEAALRLSPQYAPARDALSRLPATP
jgi:tetratricopeptide (TPR) repeat protein